MTRCSTCHGAGTYLDPQCLGDCAHKGRWVMAQDEVTGVEKRQRKKVMQCPLRACLCPAGESARAYVRAKVLRQEAALRWGR